MYPSEYTTDLVPILGVFGLLYEENKIVTELQQKRKQIDQGVASRILSTLITINSNISIWDSKKSFKIVAYDKVFTFLIKATSLAKETRKVFIITKKPRFLSISWWFDFS